MPVAGTPRQFRDSGAFGFRGRGRHPLCRGNGPINSSTGAGLPRVREGDRNAYVAESGEWVRKAFRLILNYELPLL
jgi:hypothetical protein